MEAQETDYTQLTVRLTRDLHRRFKVTQAHDGRSMNEVIVGMIEAWVKKNEPGKGGSAA